MKKDQFQEFKFNEEKVKAFFKRKKNQESHYEQLLGKAFDSFEQAINDLYESDEYSLFLETFIGLNLINFLCSLTP